MREELLTAIRRRVDAAASSGDHAEVVAEDAVAEADRLLGFLARDDDLDIEVAYVVGILHLLRAEARGEDGQDDQATAAILLAPIYLTQPDLLPDVVRAWLAAAYQAAEPAGAPPEHALAEAHNNLGMVLLGRQVRLGERHSGVAAVGLLRLAVDVLPADHPSRALALCNLGYARMLVESEDGAAPAAIDDIVAVFRESFRMTAQDDPNRARCANGLALTLRAKAAATEDVPLLVEAIGLFRTATDAATELDENLPQILTDLASSLLLWWREARDADPAAVDEAINALLRALALTPRDTPEFGERWRLMERLQMARATRDARARQDRRGTDPAGPIEAAEALLGGAGEAADDNPFVAIMGLLGMGEQGDSRHAQLMDFGRTVLRFPHQADMEEVQDKAAEMLVRRLADLEPDQLPDAISALLSADDPGPALARVDPASLDEVAELADRLVRELPEDDPDRLLARLTRSQLSLMRLLTAGHEASEQSVETMARETSKAMRELTGLVAELPRSFDGLEFTRERIEQAATLGKALLSPFEMLSVIDREVRRYRTRLAPLPEDDPDQPPTAAYLANALFQRYQHTGEENVYQEAVTLARRVVGATSPPDAKLVMAWGMAAARRTRMDSLSPSPSDDPARSSGIATLAARMAADDIAAGDPTGALENLEDARATMLSSALHTRRELDNLRRADPELAERFVALRERVYVGMNPGMEPRPGGAERYRALAEEWARLVGQIKELPGFDRFLMPGTLGRADLAPAAAEGPVVAVNVHPRRCDALVLHDGTVRAVPLPDLRAADLVEQADAFRAAIAALTGNSTVDDSVLAGAARQTVLDTLAWLWDVLAGPVLDALGFAEHAPDRGWPRLWWSPTGPLTFLPLHAAGRHDNPGASVLDRVASSYTPTLRALLHSRARRTPPGRTALTVAMPETPGHPALPATVRESAAFTGGRAGPESLVGAAATRAAVRAALPGAAIAHFACHARSDPADAAASHLLLHDGPLTVSEISQLRLDGAELAYLSACATARGSAALADESIHVVSAFQLAGYAQAVGTLWEVGDETAARVAAEFRRELAATIDDPARPAGGLALHAVIRRMRAELPDEPWRWAGYLHAGA